MNKRVLIASSSFDADTHRPVCAALQAGGADVVLYETDKVMAGEQDFTIMFSSDGALTVACDGRSIAPEDVSAAWLWKVASFRNADAAVNVSKQLNG